MIIDYASRCVHGPWISTLICRKFCIILQISSLFSVVWCHVNLQKPKVRTEDTRNAMENYGGSYCDTETFHAECSSADHVILLTQARYGRMSMGRCVQISLGYIGCYSDVLRLADIRCSGRRSCSIRVPDAEFESTRPCLKELKTYLSINYTCVSVSTLSAVQCSSSTSDDNLGVISPVEGYLASPRVASEIMSSNCQSIGRPWLITGSPGQKIVLTLLDFTLQDIYGMYPVKYSTQMDGGHLIGSGMQGTCNQYGTVQDSGRNGTILICRGERRKTTVMRSTGHSVRIWIDTEMSQLSTRDNRRFLLHYIVTGCRDPDSLPPQVWFRRTGDDGAVIGCLYHDVTWTIQCLPNNEWSDYPNNCTSERVDYQNKISETESGSEGLFVQEFTIAFCVMIGLICLLLLLSLGVWHHIRKRHTLTSTAIDINESMALRYRANSPGCLLDKKISYYPPCASSTAAYSIGTVLPPISPYSDLSMYVRHGRELVEPRYQGSLIKDHQGPVMYCKQIEQNEYQSWNDTMQQRQMDYEQCQHIGNTRQLNLQGDYSQQQRDVDLLNCQSDLISPDYRNEDEVEVQWNRKENSSPLRLHEALTSVSSSTDDVRDGPEILNKVNSEIFLMKHAESDNSIGNILESCDHQIMPEYIEELCNKETLDTSLQHSWLINDPGKLLCERIGFKPLQISRSSSQPEKKTSSSDLVGFEREEYVWQSPIITSSPTEDKENVIETNSGSELVRSNSSANCDLGIISCYT